ncbi:MAG: biopolymer transporter ExbD [Pirellulaceae bacterium]
MPLKVQRDDEISINMTPMIDIVFLLIIFFMVGTKFTEISEAERDIALTVPEVKDGQALAKSPEKRVINIYRDGSIALDTQKLTLEDLENQLREAKAQYPATGVVVRGDSESLYQHVAQVIAACRDAKINDLNIAVKPTKLR